MLEGQTNIFEMLYPTYKITKPIRLIELFSGYGSQALALKYLGVKFEHWKICEWAVKSIQAYKDIHFPEDNTDYSKGINESELMEYLYHKGISNNYNNPMTLQQIGRIYKRGMRKIYNNIQATHNLVNIQQVKGKDLEIVDTDKYEYILTYSFPCQDISGAGLRKGFEDTSTRSGMLWEVERILTECKELGTLPSVLLMENVPLVHGTENLQSWNKWQLRLEELGYKNYWQDLIATDYGIPQTRNRTFMVSILGDYNYTFPKPIPLKLKLKDMLEDNVDEKYFLSDKMINCFMSESENSKFPRKERFFQTLKTTNEDGIAATLCTTGGTRCTDNFITNKSLKETLEQNEINDTCYIDTYNRKINKEKSGTITTGVSFRNNTFLAIKKDTENYIEWEEKGKIDMNCRAWKDKVGTLNTGGETKILIKNATKQGYLEATDGDGIDLAQPNSETRRGRVQKNAIQTLTTQNNLGVCVGTYQYSKSDNFMKGKDRLQIGKEVSDTICTTQKEGVVTIGNYSPSNHNASRIVDKDHCSPTVMENHGTITATQTSDLRIRKLTPRECFRLMGVKDEDFDKVAKNQSDSSLYHLAGDSIVCQCLEAIFKEMIE